MAIVEYKLDPQNKPRSYHPKTVPPFITDGGYWFNPDSETMIGIGVDGDIPDTLVTYTLEQLQVRQRAMHVKYPLRKDPIEENDILTVDEVDAAVKTWVDERS